MKILYRYILKEHVGPFFFAFFTILFVFTLQFVTRFFDRFVGKGLEFFVVVELIVLQIAWMVVLAAPMAVLIATLVVFGNLTNSSEITVMRAGGLSLYRLIVPVLLAGVFLTIVMERFNNIVLPEANYQAKQLLRDITRAKPSFGLTENAFSGLVDGYSILVRETGDDAETLKGITIYETKEDDEKTVITAERGSITFTSDYHYLILTLLDGQMHELREEDSEEYRITTFDKHRYVFSSTGYGFERTDGNEIRRGDRELSARQLYVMGQQFRERGNEAQKHISDAVLREQETINRQRESAQPANASVTGYTVEKKALALQQVEKMLARIDREIDHMERSRDMYNKYMVEFHKKYALSFACTVFVLVGVPLGVLAKRGGFGVGAGLSLLFFVIYWSLLIMGEELSDRSLLDPGIAMWIANVVMLLIGVIALIRVSGLAIGSGR
ncbi:LptF/LptG family permease [Prosthecochloris sp. SCSIO W1101]|uniref:LptF/LptG family permease n=1 Tax=Prosthecochloris sp. SCSIO W1101 TaxID=2992242 RepID=UPI00223CDDBD|nr:LptF/LptG family permease [Prosthecochloris sp. SCSIO W1101]UZJ42297.1 LptF/LptG family permease [Prosthecochloris sp. SCSIO W1101]